MGFQPAHWRPSHTEANLPVANTWPLGTGAAGGGRLIVNTGGMDLLQWAGLASMLAAMAASAWASRQRGSHKA